MKPARVNMKIIVAGVGGQGIVYLTNILAEAAILSGVPVSISEIHGLSQRGGIVTAGIGLGKHCTGFTAKASVDFLFGLEPLETQRCLPYLHKNSSVIFGNYPISPYSVNAQTSAYPDIFSFAAYIEEQCKEVVFIKSFPSHILPVLYNVFLLGVATKMDAFPFNAILTGKAIENTVMEQHRKNTIEVFKMGIAYNQIHQTI